MAGIYLHIPFCRQKCHYCDFYKSTEILLLPNFIDSVKIELTKRVDYIDDEIIETIYFGGGTPSLLSVGQISNILNHIENEYTVSESAEITMEANPDDLSKTYLQSLKDIGFNRLSIGIQSFNDDILKLMNRRHNAKQAIEAVNFAANCGFDNISTDLIYGVPGLTLQQLKEDLQTMMSLPIMHISAYHLTYHQNTTFYHWLKKGTLQPLEEEESVNQYKLLVEETSKGGFEQYEISNFAKDNCYSKHNVGYWLGKKYLGVGPSAHSYDIISRQWNTADVKKYINSINSGKVIYEKEVLLKKDQFNEYIITNIRTKWGLSLNFIKNKFGNNQLEKLMIDLLQLSERNLGKIENEKFTLTQKGLFISDDIMTNLMVE